LPKLFSLKLTINVYTSNTLRVLDNNERQVELVTNDDSNGSEDTVVSFTSSETYSSGQNIQIKNIDFNNGNTVTRTVTNSNDCILKFDAMSALLDTGNVRKMIQEGKIPDFSTNQNVDLVRLNMGTIGDCGFELSSENPVSFVNDKMELELVEAEDAQNGIKAECDTKENNIKKIKCNITREDEKTKIDKEYSFKEELLSESNKYIILSSDENKFRILCEKEKNNKKLIIIIISCCAGAIIIISIVIVCIYCRGKGTTKPGNLKEKLKMENDKKNKGNSSKNNNNIYGSEIPINMKKHKNITEMGRMETADAGMKPETEEALNIKEKKGKRSKSKNKKEEKKKKKKSPEKKKEKKKDKKKSKSKPKNKKIKEVEEDEEED